jgi:uncharacterized protein YjbJ (UPF0337 family)
MSAPNSEQPSMLAGHAQYVKGYVAETIGSVTGSKEWTESGKQDEQAGIATMKVCFPLPIYLCCSFLNLVLWVLGWGMLCGGYGWYERLEWET